MNRNKMILRAWVLGLLFPVEMIAKASCTDNSTLLWYNAPAQQWLEALPIGNSHLGGMVYGGTTDENIQLPSLSSTIVPCPTPLNPANSVSRITFFTVMGIDYL